MPTQALLRGKDGPLRPKKAKTLVSRAVLDFHLAAALIISSLGIVVKPNKFNAAKHKESHGGRMVNKNKERKERLSIYLAKDPSSSDSATLKVESAKPPIELSLENLDSAILYIKKGKGDRFI